MEEQGLVVFKGAGALTAQSVETVRQLGALFYQSGLFPDVQSEAQACVKIMHGMTFGWSPTYSMKNVYIITAKKADGSWYPPSVEVSAQGMAGLVRRSRDYEYRVLKLDESECYIEFRHKGKIVGNSRWSRVDADRAELVNRGSRMYIKYPKAMYFAGAMRNGVRQFCADLLQGYGLQVSPLDDLPDDILEAEMDVQAIDTAADEQNGHDASDEDIEREKDTLFADPAPATPTPAPTDGLKAKVPDWRGMMDNHPLKVLYTEGLALGATEEQIAQQLVDARDDAKKALAAIQKLFVK